MQIKYQSKTPILKTTNILHVQDLDFCVICKPRFQIKVSHRNTLRGYCP